MKNIIAAVLVACGMAGCARSLDRSENRAKALENLHEIGIAFHTAADDLGGDLLRELPDAKLSWRVELLPYLGEAALYKEFKRDEPWDSPHNKTLLTRMPKVYLDPRMPADKQAEGMTHFQAFASPGQELHAVMDNSHTLNLGAIASADGTSNTFLVVEAREPVPWTKPGLLPCKPGEPLPELGVERNFLVLFCDGHTDLLPGQLPEKTIRGMITWNGNEPVKEP